MYHDKLMRRIDLRQIKPESDVLTMVILLVHLPNGHVVSMIKSVLRAKQSRHHANAELQ